jgi:spermidine synthase
MKSLGYGRRESREQRAESKEQKALGSKLYALSPLLFALLLMGFSGIIAQVLLLRELLIVFSGNELTIGIILANWLIIEAAGSFLLGRCIEGIKRKVEAFVLVQMLFSLSLPSMVYLTRSLRVLLGVAPGEGLGFLHILYSSFFILFPVTLPHGALFTFGCKIHSQHSMVAQASLPVTKHPASSVQNAGSVGRVYLYETLGTIIGGVCFVYLMVPRLHSFQIAFIVASLNLISCVSLLSPFCRSDPAGRSHKVALASISMISLLSVSYLLFSRNADEIHRSSIDRQWEGQNVVHYQNSIYGNITVIDEEGQYTFFSDGIPVITSPDPDTTFVEEFAHIPMLSHPNPREILVLSGGAGGVISEILKHPTVENVDYAELDPLLLELVRKFPTPLTQLELSDSANVKVRNMDGRLLVQSTTHQYDLILIGLSTPSDLQVNRMFTKEFFLAAKKRLKDGGLIALTLPGSLTYLSEELRNLNACILNTLRAIYPYIRVIPGDFNLFLASASPQVSLIKASLLSQRLKERTLRVDLLTPRHIEYKLHERWADWFSQLIEGYRGERNYDFLPTAVFHSLAHWNALFSPSFHKYFMWFEKVGANLVFALFAIIVSISVATIASGVLLWRRGEPCVRPCVRLFSKVSIPFAVMSTGFAGMLFDLLLIFAFQTLYGYVFHQVGILITAFMFGTAVGSLLVTSLLKRIRRDIRLLIKMELAIIVFACSLPMIFLLSSRHFEHPASGPMIFSILSFISGFLIGSEFPLATKILLKDREPKVGTAAGLLYGADLFGGWLGGLMGGIVLLPVLGVVKTCMIAVMIKLSSLFALLLLHRIVIPPSEKAYHHL